VIDSSSENSTWHVQEVRVSINVPAGASGSSVQASASVLGDVSGEIQFQLDG